MSFDPLLPTLKDHARVILDDIDEDNELISDDLINAALHAYGYIRGIRFLAGNLLVKYGNEPIEIEVTKAAGGRVVWADKFSTWKNLQTATIYVPFTGIGGSQFLIAPLDESNLPTLSES